MPVTNSNCFQTPGHENYQSRELDLPLSIHIYIAILNLILPTSYICYPFFNNSVSQLRGIPGLYNSDCAALRKPAHPALIYIYIAMLDQEQCTRRACSPAFETYIHC